MDAPGTLPEDEDKISDEVAQMARAQRNVVPGPRTPDLRLLVLAGIGLLLSAYLVWTRAAHGPVYCPLGSGCDIVQSSRYAAVFGIPVALLGLLFYGFLFAVAARPLEAKRRLRLALPAAFAGAASSAVFIAVQQTAIRAACSLCLVSAALTVAILIALIVSRKGPVPGLTWAAGAGMSVLAVAFLLWGYAASAPPPPQAAYAEGLARHLAASGVKLYGAYWCPHCTDQKEMFGAAAGQLPYIECDGRSPLGKPTVCAAAGIRAFPTWDIGGTRYEGVLSLEELARLSGYSPPP
jgi:uncharacterized membrane protein